MKFMSSFTKRYQALAEVSIDITLMIILSLCVYIIHKVLGGVETVLAIVLAIANTILFCLYVKVRKDIIRANLIECDEYEEKD